MQKSYIGMLNIVDATLGVSVTQTAVVLATP